MDLPRGQEQTPRVTSVPVKHLQPLCEAFDRTHLRGTVCWFPVRHAESDDSEERRSLFPRRPPLEMLKGPSAGAQIPVLTFPFRSHRGKAQAQVTESMG